MSTVLHCACNSVLLNSAVHTVACSSEKLQVGKRPLQLGYLFMIWNENSYRISSSFTFRKCFSFYPGMRMRHPVLRHGSPETAQSCTQLHYRKTNASRIGTHDCTHVHVVAKSAISLVTSLRLSAGLSATSAQASLDGFPWKINTGDFMKIGRENPSLVKTWQ